MRVQYLHLVRHGQAQHNPRAEVARAAGCSFDHFLQLMREDDPCDAALTPLGREQATELRSSLVARTRPPAPELIVVSPLSRAIDTARLVFPAETSRGSFICLEALRERNGLLLNGQRRLASELAALYPSCNFRVRRAVLPDAPMCAQGRLHTDAHDGLSDGLSDWSERNHVCVMLPRELRRPTRDGRRSSSRPKSALSEATMLSDGSHNALSLRHTHPLFVQPVFRVATSMPKRAQCSSR